MFMNVLEPVTLLTALSGATTHIGLGGTVSTSFSEPYNVARQFASLDHVSGWPRGLERRHLGERLRRAQFGHTTLPPHALRYERASEFVDVVRALWDTWDDDAFIRDRDSGLYFDPAGAACRPPRGQVLQGRRRAEHRPLAAGPSRHHPGRRLRHRAGSGGAHGGDRVRLRSSPESAKRGYDELKGRMAQYGRDPDTLRSWPAFPS